MALQDVQPFSTYTYQTVLPRLGIGYRESDDSAPGYFRSDAEDTGSSRIGWEEGMPTDPNLQYAPAALYERDLRQ